MVMEKRLPKRSPRPTALFVLPSTFILMSGRRILSSSDSSRFMMLILCLVTALLSFVPAQPNLFWLIRKCLDISRMR